MVFCSFSEWKKWEREIFSVVRNFDAWHIKWNAGKVQFCQGWTLHCPWEKLPKFGKFSELWKISPFMFSAVAVVDTDAAAPICVCLHHSCLGWAKPICCCCFSLLGGCGGLLSMNALCCSCCCPLSRRVREIWLKKYPIKKLEVWGIRESRLG